MTAPVVAAGRGRGRLERLLALQGVVSGVVTGLMVGAVAWAAANQVLQGGNWGTDRVTAVTMAAWILGFNLGVGTWNAPIGWLLGWDPGPDVLATEAGVGRGSSRYWRFCTDHKVVGLQFTVLAMALLAVGGVGAVLIRTQLVTPHSSFLSPTAYGDLVTLHGLCMVIGVLLLIIGPFASFVVPLMIGARTVALPRLNAMGLWIMASASACLVATVVIGGADVGWTAYAPLSDQASPATTALAVAVIGLVVCVVTTGINTVVTVVRLRATGMTAIRMPMLPWGTAVGTALALASVPGVLLVMTFVLADRTMGTSFFLAPQGGSAELYELAFWITGQPLLYVLLIPPTAAVLEVASTFARRPVFNPRLVVAGFVTVALISLATLGHHLYTTGLSTTLTASSMVLTELIAVPVGVVLLCVLGTVWRGSIWARLPMYFMYLFLWDMLVGGVSGAMLGNPTADRDFHGGTVVTAHLHFTMVGSVLVAVSAGLCYWYPKLTGRMLDERTGKVAFWTIALGIQVTFLAQFWAGAEGMPRRVAWYDAVLRTPNEVSTAGAYLLTAGWVVLLWALMWSLRNGRVATGDPWRARTLEWRTPTPVPLRNFPVTPVVTGPPYAATGPAPDDDGRVGEPPVVAPTGGERP